MTRNGKLPPGVALEPFTLDGSPRCQHVRVTWEEDKVTKKEYGVQCKNQPVPGRPFCRWHGGFSGAPVKSGSQSKYNPVPKNLQKKFEDALNNPEILNLSRGIALLDSQVWQICEEAASQDNFTPIQRKQLSRLLKEHKDLVAQETNRRIAMGSLMDVAEVMQIINFIYDSIVKNIHDPNARIRISNDLRIIVSDNFPATVRKSDALGSVGQATEPEEVKLEPGEEPDYEYYYHSKFDDKDGESKMIDNKGTPNLGPINDTTTEEETQDDTS